MGTQIDKLKLCSSNIWGKIKAKHISGSCLSTRKLNTLRKIRAFHFLTPVLDPNQNCM